MRVGLVLPTTQGGAFAANAAEALPWADLSVPLRRDNAIKFDLRVFYFVSKISVAIYVSKVSIVSEVKSLSDTDGSLARRAATSQPRAKRMRRQPHERRRGSLV